MHYYHWRREEDVTVITSRGSTSPYFDQQVTLAAGQNQDLTAKMEAVGPPPFTAKDVAGMLEGKMAPKARDYADSGPRRGLRTQP